LREGWRSVGCYDQNVRREKDVLTYRSLCSGQRGVGFGRRSFHLPNLTRSLAFGEDYAAAQKPHRSGARRFSRPALVTRKPGRVHDDPIPQLTYLSWRLPRGRGYFLSGVGFIWRALCPQWR
jgi:hypothetical protein